MNYPFTTIKKRNRLYVIAHRGNQVACPENTLAAFRKALSDGADIIETDLRLTADNTFVCIHDSTVDRTTDGDGRVDQMTLSRFKSLSAFYGREEFKDEKIPTLAEVATILPDDVGLAIELKDNRFYEPETCRKLIDELDRIQIRNRTIVLSHSKARLNTIRSVAPDIVAGKITLFNPLPLQNTQLLGPFWLLLLINPFYVWIAHKRGKTV